MVIAIIAILAAMLLLVPAWATEPADGIDRMGNRVQLRIANLFACNIPPFGCIGSNPCRSLSCASIRDREHESKSVVLYAKTAAFCAEGYVFVVPAIDPAQPRFLTCWHAIRELVTAGSAGNFETSS